MRKIVVNDSFSCLVLRIIIRYSHMGPEANPLDISNFEDYRNYLSLVIDSRPNGGHGAISEFAKILEVNKSFISKVINGHHAFSRQQVFILSKHLNLPDLETEYFMELVDLEKCTSSKFRSRIRANLIMLRKKIRSELGHSPDDQPLDDYAKSIFYSNWSYAGVHLLMGFECCQTPDLIAHRLRIDRAELDNILRFLVACGMSKTDGIKFFPSIKSTHLGLLSPFRLRHHMNWRLKAVDSISSSKPDDVHFTAPMRISSAAKKELARRIESLIEETKNVIDGKHASGEEDLLCMNIDLFEF